MKDNSERLLAPVKEAGIVTAMTNYLRMPHCTRSRELSAPTYHDKTNSASQAYKVVLYEKPQKIHYANITGVQLSPDSKFER